MSGFGEDRPQGVAGAEANAEDELFDDLGEEDAEAVESLNDDEFSDDDDDDDEAEEEDDEEGYF